MRIGVKYDWGRGRALAERYGFAVFDAMIVAAALIAGCITLWTEDCRMICW